VPGTVDAGVTPGKMGKKREKTAERMVSGAPFFPQKTAI
jgi:hypothetical protein